jgi:hypothetical protein
MSHPEQSTSRKVTALTDFEYRVWEQTKLSSDDFGVMPYAAAILRADNLRLLAAKESVVFAALKRLVLSGLLIVFEHQGVSYACAPVWQTWQTIKFPRASSRPKPPNEILAQCDEATRGHFAQHPGGGRPTRDGSNAERQRRFRERRKALRNSQNDDDTERHLSVTSNVKVHAYADANANANARESARGGPRPFDRGHADHIHGFCDFKCLSEEKLWQFAKDLPGGQADPENFTRALAWAEGVRDTWGDQPKLEFEWFKFWEARWKERSGGSQAALQQLVARVQERLS